MKSEIKELQINGVCYVEKGTEAAQQEVDDRYCIVRTKDAGVFAGSPPGGAGDADEEMWLENARRLWYWKGAASLSQLAMEGVKCPEECKFAMPVTEIFLTGVIEVIPCTAAARKNIASVKEWKS